MARKAPSDSETRFTERQNQPMASYRRLCAGNYVELEREAWRIVNAESGDTEQLLREATNRAISRTLANDMAWTAEDTEVETLMYQSDIVSDGLDAFTRSIRSNGDWVRYSDGAKNPITVTDKDGNSKVVDANYFAPKREQEAQQASVHDLSDAMRASDMRLMERIGYHVEAA